MEELVKSWSELQWRQIMVVAVEALGILLLGFLLARLLQAWALRLLRSRVNPQAALLWGRGFFVATLGLALLAALNRLGVDFTLLVGAAGVLTVALGFAAQTSVSNLISGLFLVAERPFEIGHIIEVGGVTGEVLSVDSLSVKLRTFDNRYVRLPNETLLKSEITNLSRFPIRRIDMKLRIGFGEDLRAVETLLKATADRHPLCLDEPRPLLFVRGFGESGIDIQFSVWAAQEDYLEARNGIQREVVEAFSAADIEIPLPQRVVTWKRAADGGRRDGVEVEEALAGEAAEES
jgi:small-conductance mechanosensitive channel